MYDLSFVYFSSISGYEPLVMPGDGSRPEEEKVEQNLVFINNSISL